MTNAPDDVDLIVQAWRRERPDLDISPLEVLSRVTRIAKRVESARKAAFRASSLESWEFDVLAALRRAGAPYQLSPKQLMAENLVSSGAMTHRITKLHHRGLVARESDPDDGRGAVVRLTPQGLRAVDNALEYLVQAEHSLVRALSPHQRQSVAEALRVLSRDVSQR